MELRHGASGIDDDAARSVRVVCATAARCPAALCLRPTGTCGRYERGMRWLAVVFVALIVVVTTASSPVAACAVCGCGTNAALPAGAEQPFAGRLRTTLSLSTSSTVEHEAVDSTAVGATAALAVSGAVDDRVVVDAFVPVGVRAGFHGEDFEGWGAGVGDVGGGVRFVVSDRRYRPRLTGSLRLGLLAPTTTLLRDDNGAPMSSHLQPGNAELAAQLTTTLTWLASPTLTFVGVAAGSAPAWSAATLKSGTVAEVHAFTLLRANDSVSVRAGAAALIAGSSRAAAVDGHDGRAAVAPEVGVTVEPALDVAVSFVVAVPVRIAGSVDDGPRVSLSLSRDW